MRASAFLLIRTSILVAILSTPRARADSTLTTLVVFNGTNGARPDGGLLLGRDGNFYGTTAMGGGFDVGTVFRMTPDGRLTTLASFDVRNGKWPGDLVQGKDGSFYGTAVQGGSRSGDGVVFKMAQHGKLTTLFSFSDYDDKGNESPDGFSPNRLVYGTDGNFYGTTAHSDFGQGEGTVFRITPNGALTTLATFAPHADAAWLVRALDGNFYFTTAKMGFRLAPLADIGLIGKVGSINTLVQGKDGSFYGTTPEGGPKSGGTVFRMNSSGLATNLVTFDVNNSVNGRTPISGLILGEDGYFYGTTFAGDTNGAPPDLTKFLTRDASGAFVVINKNGPIPSPKPDLGTVFRMTPNGTITTLVVFYRTNGCYPVASLVEGKDGNFYGTTSEGGVGINPRGTIFRLVVSPPSSRSTR